MTAMLFPVWLSFFFTDGIYCVMISFSLFKTEFRLEFSFFASVTFFLISDLSVWGLCSLMLCMIHESAHLFAMLLFNVSPSLVRLYGAGISIRSEMLDYAPYSHRIIILSAGCAMNFLCALILYINSNHLAAIISLFTGLFNLLPVGDLDGAQILKSVMLRHCRAERISFRLRIAEIIALCISVPSALLLVWQNKSAAVIAVYVILAELIR